MASAAALSLAPGNAGWTMPRLDGVATAHKIWFGDRVAAVIGSGLLRAGVASADTWAFAERDPFQFVQLSIKQFVDRHDGPSIRETFQVNLSLTGTLNEYSTGDREIEAASLFLTIDPTEAGYLVLGSTLRILEEQHPRLPATFFHLLCGALNRWVRVYDYREALEHVERLRDWYTADPDSGDIEVPDVEGSIPACMRQKPLSGNAEGVVCQGTMRSPAEASVAAMAQWERSFFESEFTHIYGSGHFTQHSGGVAVSGCR